MSRPADEALADRIEKLASRVARVGPQMESMVKEKQGDNPDFAFLSGGEGAGYYAGIVGRSALPPGWVEARDPRYDNTTYYVDTRTRETSWTRPESRERLPPPLPATPAMPSYVRLRGLPFQATELDVAQWFFSALGGITIGSVHFIYDNTGRKSGEAVSAPRLYLTSVPDPHSLPPPLSSLLSCATLGWRSGRCSRTTRRCGAATSRSS